MVESDVDLLVELALRAWEPVFTSLRHTLGDGLFARLRPDWRRDQEDAVRTVCRQEHGMVVHVAESALGRPAGFVAYVADPESGLGVVEMLGVHPDEQRRGIGTRLTEHAYAELREAGMQIAMVETGAHTGPTHLRAGGRHAAADRAVLHPARRRDRLTMTRSSSAVRSGSSKRRCWSSCGRSARDGEVDDLEGNSPEG